MLVDQTILRFPGPTPIAPSVQRALNQPMYGRGPETAELITQIQPKLKPVFGTSQEVAIISGSGTAGLETSVVSLTKPDEEVLVLVTGRFGEVFVDICQAHGIKVHRLDWEWGEVLDPDQVKNYLKQHPHIKLVFSTFCETSTGVINPMKELAQAIHESSDALLISDGVSSVGGVEAKMDEWGIDVLVTGSQKAMMVPAGLALVAFSERAKEVAKKNTRPRYFFDYNRYLEQIGQGGTPFTPALALLYALDQSLNLMHEEGLERVFERHNLVRDMTRAAFKAWDVPLMAADEVASPTVTAIVPDDFDPEQLIATVKKDFNIALAGGLGKMIGKMIRVGHMGYCGPSDALQYISAIEIALEKIGKKIQLGEGIKAAQEVFINYQRVKA